MQDVRGEKVAVIPVMAVDGVLDWWIKGGNVDQLVYEDFLWACVVCACQCYAQDCNLTPPITQMPHIRPWPEPHSVVVLDGASFHKMRRFARAVRRLGGHVLFLPPHCPFDNPVRLPALSPSCWTELTRRHCAP